MLAPRCAATLSLCLLVSHATDARATDAWSVPAPGIRHLHRTTEHQDLHVVLVDAADPSLRIVATAPDEAFHTVSTFAARHEAAVAINANFFATGPCGLAAGDGTIWRDAYDDGCTASMAFGADGLVVPFDSTSALFGPVPQGATEAVSGKPWLVRDGAVDPSVDAPGMSEPNPRTAIGWARDVRTLILLVVDGRRAGAEGMTGSQLADVMLEFGADAAFNLDGGGSSEMVIPSEGGVVNQPSDGVERSVVNQLAVIAAAANDAGATATAVDASSDASATATAVDASSDARDGGDDVRDGDDAAPESAHDPEPGCSCATPGTARTSSTPLAALLAGAVAIRIRRRVR